MARLGHFAPILSLNNLKKYRNARGRLSYKLVLKLWPDDEGETRAARVGGW